jgi:putative peptidoglycan lipid II flippase
MIVNVLCLFGFSWLFSFDNSFSFTAVALLRLVDIWHVVDLRVLALPLAISVSSIYELVVLMFALRKKIGLLDGRKLLDSSLRIIFASLGAGLMAYVSLQIIDRYLPTEKVYGIFFQGLISGFVGLAGYWLLGVVLSMEEMFIFFSSIRRKLFKSAVVMAEDSIGEADQV